MKELTTIQLSHSDALMFIEFQKHYSLIGLLDSVGAFRLRNGSITLHFDSMGQIRLLNKNENFKPELMGGDNRD